MKNRSRIAMLLFGIAMSIGLVTQPAFASRAIHVRHMNSYDALDIHRFIGTFHTSARVYWNWSNYAGDSAFGKKAWAKPTEAYVHVNRGGIVESCGIFDDYKGTNVRFRFTNPTTGATITTRWHHLPCRRDTTAGLWIDLSNIPRFHYVGLDPRWRAEVQNVVRAYVGGTKTYYLSGRFSRS